MNGGENRVVTKIFLAGEHIGQTGAIKRDRERLRSGKIRPRSLYDHFSLL